MAHTNVPECLEEGLAHSQCQEMPPPPNKSGVWALVEEAREMLRERILGIFVNVENTNYCFAKFPFKQCNFCLLSFYLPPFFFAATESHFLSDAVVPPPGGVTGWAELACRLPASLWLRRSFPLPQAPWQRDYSYC